MNFPVETGVETVNIHWRSTHPHVCPQARMWTLWIPASIVAVRLLFPESRVDVAVDDLYRTVPARPEGRPWVGLCMVASLDGTTEVDGRSGALGNRTDIEVLRSLRSRADVVIVGSRTAHIERYRAPSKRGQRVGVVTSTGDVDLSLPLFESGAGFLITTAHAPTHGLHAIRSSGSTVDLAHALAQLDADIVHAEGGPTLNAALLEADLVDELNLTVAPHLVGGAGQRLTSTGSTELMRSMHLVHVATDDSYLFLRYVRATQAGSSTR